MKTIEIKYNYHIIYKSSLASYLKNICNILNHSPEYILESVQNYAFKHIMCMYLCKIIKLFFIEHMIAVLTLKCNYNQDNVYNVMSQLNTEDNSLWVKYWSTNKNK